MKIHNFTICDQVRVEDNGKFILLGVYSNGIIFPQLPVQYNMTFWMLAEHEKLGPGTFAVRGRMPEIDVDIFEISGGYEAIDLKNWTPLAFGVTMLIGQSGKMVVELKADDEEWRELRSVDITKGNVPSFMTAPKH